MSDSETQPEEAKEGAATQPKAAGEGAATQPKGAGEGAAGIAPGKEPGEPSAIHGPREDKPEDATVPVAGTGSGVPAMAATTAAGGFDVDPNLPEHDDLAALRDALGEDFVAAGARLGEATGLVRREVVAQAAEFLRDERGYQMLTDLTAVDFLPGRPRFQVVYLFTGLPEAMLKGQSDPGASSAASALPSENSSAASPAAALPAEDASAASPTSAPPSEDSSAVGESTGLRRLRLKVAVPEDDAVVPSLTGVYPTANWHEREAYDLFGIEFAGHPNLDRILLPDDTEGFPLRKDHGVVYEEVAFTHNVDQVYGSKPFATE